MVEIFKNISMIEVEKKFILSEEDRKRLTKGAQFLGERVFTDVYFDTQSFSLTKKEEWLRSREGKFELKISLGERIDGSVDRYDEIEDEEKIREFINLAPSGNFSDALKKAGYSPFCFCKTARRKYKKNSFILDLDVVDFQDFSYNIAEIELMVKDKIEIEKAIEKIMLFAKEQDLAITPVRGKVIEYLKQKRPEHYQSLVKAGVVKDF